MFTGFISAEHEKYVMTNHPKLWKEWVKKFGHHQNVNDDGRGKRRVGGVKKSSNRRVLKYGRKNRHGRK
jgi:hypothetical protein